MSSRVVDTPYGNQLIVPATGGPGGVVNAVVAGTNVTVDSTDPVNPIVAAPNAVVQTLVDAKGDLIVGTADNVVARKAVGADGTVLTADAASAGGMKWQAAAGGGAPYLQRYLVAGTGLYETVPRWSLTAVENVLNTPLLYAVALPAGLVVSKIGFMSAAAVNTPVHYYFGLFDNAFHALAFTADAGSAAWGATVQKELAIATVASGAASSFTTTYEGLHYVFCRINATSVTLSGATAVNAAGTDMATPILQMFCSNDPGVTPPAFPYTATNGGHGTVGQVYGTVG